MPNKMLSTLCPPHYWKIGSSSVLKKKFIQSSVECPRSLNCFYIHYLTQPKQKSQLCYGPLPFIQLNKITSVKDQGSFEVTYKENLLLEIFIVTWYKPM